MTDGPMRTCVACRTRRSASGLLRLRRRADGVVVPDMARTRGGRSAWLCPSRGCVTRAVHRRVLPHALGGPRKLAVRVPEGEALLVAIADAVAERLAVLTRTIPRSSADAARPHAEQTALTAMHAALRHAGEVT